MDVGRRRKRVLSDLPDAPKSSIQLQERTGYDGPAWIIRHRSGYRGPAWFDLPPRQTNSAATDTPNATTSSRSLGVQTQQKLPLKYSSLLSRPPELAPVAELIHISKNISRNMQIETNPSPSAHDTRLEISKHCNHESTCYCTCFTSQHDRTSLSSEYIDRAKSKYEIEEQAADEMLQIKLREMILAKAEARRLELRLYERLANQYNMDTTKKLTSQEYHLPRTLKLMDAKDASERAQESAVRRNWPRIKTYFDMCGGVLSLPQLREALLACDITVPHAGRIVLRASSLLMVDEDLITYDVLCNYYFGDQDEAYETDSDAEIEAFVHAPFCEDHIYSGRDGKYYRTRRVRRLRMKIKAAVHAKGILISPTGGLDIDDVLDDVGISIKYLKQLDKEWLHDKPYHKSSNLHQQQGNRENLPALSRQSSRADWTPACMNDYNLKTKETLTEAVFVVRYRAVNQINALARGALVRLRARYIWEETIIAKAYHIRVLRLIRKWFVWSRRLQFMNKNIRKVFCRWRSHVRRLHKEREFFRHMFWPFYVWRRYTHQNILAKKKAKFLKRVWHTLVMLRHFQAWRQRTQQSHALANRAMRQLFNHNERILELHFTVWRKWARQAKRIEDAWVNGGKVLRLQVLLGRTRRYWCAWKLFTRVMRWSRRTALRYYNVVPTLFASKQKHYRMQLGLPQRAYVTEDEMTIPPWPSLQLFMGLEDSSFIERYDMLHAGLCKFHAEMQEQTRNKRLTTCIERNRLGGNVFKCWRAVVQAGQKDRYAWYHYIIRLKRQVFKAWDNVTNHSVSASKRGKSPPATSAKSNHRHTNGHRGTLFFPGSSLVLDSLQQDAGDSIMSIQLETPMEAMQRRRASLRQLQEERAERSQQFLGDPNFRKQSLRNATMEAGKVRRERLARQIQLREHDTRLRLAQENLDLSENNAHEMLEERRLQLEETKRMQIEHAQRLRAMRARMMHNALYSVFDQLEAQRMDQILRTCFRMLRFPIIARRSFGLMHQKRLENWVRICIQFRRLYNSMPKYYRLRLKYSSFNKWLSFMDARIRGETPGLREEINHRRSRLVVFSNYLRQNGEGVASDPKNARVWFLRWVEFAQRTHCRRRIAELTKECSRLQLMQRAWAGWRSGLKTIYTEDFRNEETLPFTVSRCKYDLDKWKCRMVVLEQRMLSTKLRKRNHYIAKTTRNSILDLAKRPFTLLKFVLERHRSLVYRRLELEMRLLCSAFNERGTFSYSDKRSMCVGLPLSKASGARHFTDTLMDSGVNTYGINVAVSEGMVVGLQLRFRSGPKGASRVWEGPVHGFTRVQRLRAPGPSAIQGEEDTVEIEEGEILKVAGVDNGSGGKASAPSGASMMHNGSGGKRGPQHGFGTAQGLRVYEFLMQDPHERITQIEGYSMNNMVGGKLRFRTSNGRISPWYGSCESGKRFVLPDGPEMTSFGKNRFEEEFIVGFHGACTNNAILSLGVLLRQVEKKNVFSRCWLDRVDSLMDMDTSNMDEANIEEQQAYIDHQKLLHQRQFNSVLAMRRAGVEHLLKRSMQLGRRLRYGATVPEPLRKVGVVDRIMRWFFNALSKKLVSFSSRTHRLARVSMQDSSLSRGYMMIQQGNTRLRNAKKQLRRLQGLAQRRKALQSDNDAYDESAKLSKLSRVLTQAEIGEKRHRDLQEAIAHQEREIGDAQRLILQGRSNVDHGLHNMPKLDTSVRILVYYEDLVRLAQIKDQIGT